MHALNSGQLHDEPDTRLANQELARSGLWSGTPVTLETFTAWKKKKQEEREAEEERKKQERIAQAKKEKRSVMSGRDLFTFDPTLFADDEDASSDSSDEEESDEEDNEVDTPQHVLQSTDAAALFSKDEELPDDD
ncbi:hypothetical protein FOZ62_018587 [Perkinsus olseni]|uniref:ZC3H15/TMA46 family C-terminal domain-containing protein n=1 Tax=Perkinsus olseni TaxID=32597 RepID=A0A7J6TPQ5_PEROL|nr:hypothetical protein FOZ62_018587 [Perkinsus olseni]